VNRWIAKRWRSGSCFVRSASNSANSDGWRNAGKCMEFAWGECDQGGCCESVVSTGVGAITATDQLSR
jgi:hypothetical protein